MSFESKEQARLIGGLITNFKKSAPLTNGSLAECKLHLSPNQIGLTLLQFGNKWEYDSSCKWQSGQSTLSIPNLLAKLVKVGNVLEPNLHKKILSLS